MAETEASRLAIVVEELVTNLYDHGGLNDEAVFTIELSLTTSDLSLVLADPGEPFDPFPAKFDRPVSARGGGAGLNLVREWASQMDYESTAELNRLRLRLPRRSDQF
jgi:serine/threonine-protein kinase RsbW